MSVGSWYRGAYLKEKATRLSPGAFRRLAVVSLVAVCLIVLTGAAVRLTGSGLGCPDWPSCYHTAVTPQLSLHPLVEFSNRMVTVALVVLLAVTFLGALCRRPFRGDLTWIATGLLAGVVAQALIGALAVYTKLNPYVVLLHFLASMVLVALAVILVHRAGRDHRVAGRALVGRPLMWSTRGAATLLGLVLVAGTFTTGTGPHAGNAGGQLVARRIPVALRDMAELHSSLAVLLIGLLIGLAVALHVTDVPEALRRKARVLVVVVMLQGVIGYVQYFTHLPAALVELHILGATALVAATADLVVSLVHHPREVQATRPALAPAPRSFEPAAGRVAGFEPRSEHAPIV
ncbi:MAG: COX15/CtaA family protein [Acidimicrobiales bacterium]